MLAARVELARGFRIHLKCEILDIYGLLFFLLHSATVVKFSPHRTGEQRRKIAGHNGANCHAHRLQSRQTAVRNKRSRIFRDRSRTGANFVSIHSRDHALPKRWRILGASGQVDPARRVADGDEPRNGKALYGQGEAGLASLLGLSNKPLNRNSRFLTQLGGERERRCALPRFNAGDSRLADAKSLCSFSLRDRLSRAPSP